MENSDVNTRIIYVSPYYDPKVPSGANRRFDEVCKRFLADYGESFTLMVSRGKVPEWWNGKNLVEIDYEFNHLSKFKAEKQIASELDKRPPSIVIMESIPIPFKALARHKHFQAAYRNQDERRLCAEVERRPESRTVVQEG